MEPSTLLTETDLQLVSTKSLANRLPFALLLAHYKAFGSFADDLTPLEPEYLALICKEIGFHREPNLQELSSAQRTWKRHRQEIRELFGTCEATLLDGEELSNWLCDHVVPESRDIDELAECLRQQCRDQRLEPPTAERIERIVRAAVSTFDERLCGNVSGQLVPDMKSKLDLLIQVPEGADEGDGAVAPVLALRKSPGRPSVNSIKTETAKLRRIREIGLPPDLFASVRPYDVERYRQRVSVEAPYELRRHADSLRHTMLAAFVHVRGRAVTDDLVDLLVETIHLIGARAETKAQKEFENEFKKIRGKEALFCAVADAALERPEGLIRDVVFPVADEQTLRDIVREFKSKAIFKKTVQKFIANSYKGHYRKMVPQLLEILEFRSNNDRHRPVMDALAVIRRNADSKGQYLPLDEIVPLDGLVKDAWRDAVTEKDAYGNVRVLRLSYEICVLAALREKLRCKEIWVVGADRYRNPDDDLPADFDDKREEYYAALNLPCDPQAFVTRVRDELRAKLTMLNAGMPANDDVHITSRKGGWITLTPLDEQPEPSNIAKFKQELHDEYKLTSLLDMLKEADLQLGFTNALKSPTAHENMPRSELQPRLLRCIFGHGTNTGLTRMAPLGSGTTEKDLRYVSKRYLSVDALREAIVLVTNGTLRARVANIWGSGTSCASDSKHFGAWDQNLTSQWHLRYGGRGVMIYWHVEKKSLCIYSQLKSPSSSEAASMIEGVLRHDTEAEVDQQFVDSHGQTEVAFAFTYCLGFDLMPRIKRIGVQKLYRPDDGDAETYPHLKPVLSFRCIDWDLIAQQYDEIVKYTTALRLSTSSADAILRRFTRNNTQHPTYKALAELGKAIKTMFLCRYLDSRDVRREIHEGLNVVEHWNGANDFLFFARQGLLASNQKEDHETSMLCLHLLQNCMVFINTLIIQRILGRPHWQNKMTERDLKALTPLIWDHVNPYGRFDLDMTTRLSLD